MTGRLLPPRTPGTYFCFFSAGFRICRRVSSVYLIGTVEFPSPSSHLERAEQALVHTHHGSSIVEFSAVVRCTEQGHELALGEELVTVFHDLVGTADQIHIVLLKEPGHNVGTESEGDTSVVFAPACDVLVGIRPQQIAEKTAIGNLWFEELVNK